MDPEKNSASAAGQATERSGPVTNRVPRDDLRKTVITFNEVNGHFLQAGGHWFESLIAHSGISCDKS